jgi:hypothetical protein
MHSGFAEFTDYEGTDTVVRVSISLLTGEQGRKFSEVETRWADSGAVLVNSQPKYIRNCEFSDAGRVLASSGHGTLILFTAIGWSTNYEGLKGVQELS